MVIKKKIKRFNLVLLFILGGGLSLFFLLKALEEEIVFFYTPSAGIGNILSNGLEVNKVNPIKPIYIIFIERKT